MKRNAGSSAVLMKLRWKAVTQLIFVPVSDGIVAIIETVNEEDRSAVETLLNDF